MPLLVTLRIDRLEKAGVMTIRIAGRLDVDGVDELNRACEGAPASMRLDLSELRAVDPAGLVALLALEHAGAVFSGVPPYIGLRLSAARRRGARGSERRS